MTKTSESKATKHVSFHHLNALYELTKRKGSLVLTDIWTWKHPLASLSASERPNHLLISRPGTLNSTKAEHFEGLVLTWDKTVSGESLLKILEEHHCLPKISHSTPSPKRRWWRRNK